jgi:hypothetical protein
MERQLSVFPLPSDDHLPSFTHSTGQVPFSFLTTSTKRPHAGFLFFSFDLSGTVPLWNSESHLQPWDGYVGGSSSGGHPWFCSIRARREGSRHRTSSLSSSFSQDLTSMRITLRLCFLSRYFPLSYFPSYSFASHG